MNSLKILRAELTDVLESTNLECYDHLPRRVNPPIGIILAGSPYLEQGSTFGSFQVNYNVLILTKPGANAVQTDEIDKLTTAAIVALANSGWAVETVSQPTYEELNGVAYLGVIINVSKPSHIDDGR